MSLLAPVEYDTLSADEMLRNALARETGFGEYWRSKFGEAWDMGVAGRLLDETTTPGRAPADLEPTAEGELNVQTGDYELRYRDAMPEEAWKASRHWRKEIPYDPGMTEARAEALARSFDEREFRKSLVERYEGGLTEQLFTNVSAGLLAGALDPTSYIPILGPGARAAAVARLGVVGGYAAVAATEAALTTAAAEPFIAASLATRGETVTAADMALDVLLSAGVGTIFGSGAGLLAGRAIRQETALRLQSAGVQRQADALSAAMVAIARDEPVDVGPIVRADLDLRRRLMGTAAIPEPAEAPRFTVDEQGNVTVTAARQSDPIAGDMEYTTVPGAPKAQGLVAFLRQRGGIRDEGGELRARDAIRQRPGLVNRRGMSLDEAAEAATEAGYIGRHSTSGVEAGERGSIDDLLAALDDELRGETAYPVSERARLAAETEERRLAAEARSEDDEIIRRAEAGGYGDLSGVELGLARRLVQEHGYDYDDAIVQAQTQAALRDDGGTLDAPGITEDDFDIPFGDVAGRAEAQPGAARAAPGAAGGQREGLGLGRAADGGTGDLDAFVRSLVAREVEEAQHPSITEAEARLPLMTRSHDELEGLAEDLRLADEIPELADVERLRKDGRLTAADEAELADADEVAVLAEKYAQGYESLATCTLRYG